MDHLSGKRILLCEDNPLQATLLHAIALKAKMEVVGIAFDGREALKRALSERPDIILSDVEMPMMDGLTAARQILAEYPACIVFLSGNDDPDHLRQVEEMGAAGYLLKPYRGQKLLEQIEECVVRWQENGQAGCEAESCNEDGLG